MSALRDALRDLPDAVFVDVLERDDEYLLVVDLPGVRASTVDVTATSGRLRIEARREKDVPREFRYLQEDRALFLDADLPLPPEASAEGASGTVEKGVLELHLPKRDIRTETQVPIDGDEGGDTAREAGGTAVGNSNEPSADADTDTDPNGADTDGDHDGDTDADGTDESAADS